MAKEKRRKNITKFERNNKPFFRLYNGQKGKTEIHFNDLAVQTYKIDVGDQLLVDPKRNMFTVVGSWQNVSDYKGYLFSKSDNPNIYFRTHADANIKSGIYSIDPNKRRIAGAYWIKYEWQEPLATRKVIDAKTPEKRKTKTKDTFDFVIRSFESQGRKLLTFTCSLDEGKKIGMKANKYLIFSPENHMLAVSKQESDHDSDFIGYKAYIIKRQKGQFVVVNILNKVFNKTGVFTVTEENVYENNQKFYKYYFNKKNTSKENKILRNRDNKEELLQASPIEKDSFKYDKAPLIKMYDAKNKQQKQMVVLFNYQLAKDANLKDDDYISVIDNNTIKISNKRNEEGSWYKVAKKDNQYEARVNLDKFNLKEGDYSVKVRAKDLKLSKLQEGMNHLKNFNLFLSTNLNI